ncbi:organomercurial lyase [Pseudonocardia nigra]|uniref:organomercurial lyase n=1 Tax=Pseudonocardia nigra TaxID=1921578 RepID=UPI001C5EEFD0|nr:organomercurial lyase [Pseudonocardia nigra]
MTSTNATPAIAELTRPGGALDLGTDKARLLIRMLRLLAQGQPVTRDHALAATADLGIEREQVHIVLDAWTERDDDGRIVGLGVTHNPSPHQMTVDGVRMWAWCGMDTLIFAHVLDKPIAIESTAPGTSEVVRLHASPSGVTDVDPVEAVATQRVPRNDQVDFSTATAIWGTFCHHNHFFPNRAQAEQWAAGRDDIVILSIPDAFAAARDMGGALLRYEPETAR